MRVALFTETYLPHVNGVVTHVKSLKDGLEQLGHEVLIVTADASARRHYVSDGVLHCPAHTSKRFYGYGVAMPLSTTRLKYVYQFRPDVIHIHNEFGIGLSGMMIAKVLRVALVYTLHTMYDEYIYYIAPQPLVPAATKFSHQYTKLFAKLAQEVTGPSKKCEEYFRKAGVYKPVNVIPNPVDLDMFDPGKIPEEKKNAFREKFGYQHGETVGLFVGRLGREKSVDLLLDYWKKTIRPEENIRLLVIGDGPCREELEEQAVRLGITDMVTFAGKVLHTDMPPYVGTCDFYITASTSDTDSISMLEGMAMGLPSCRSSIRSTRGRCAMGSTATSSTTRRTWRTRSACSKPCRRTGSPPCAPPLGARSSRAARSTSRNTCSRSITPRCTKSAAPA